MDNWQGKVKFEGGVMRWIKSGLVPSIEIVCEARLLGYPVDIAQCNVARIQDSSPPRTGSKSSYCAVCGDQKAFGCAHGGRDA